MLGSIAAAGALMLAAPLAAQTGPADAGVRFRPEPPPPERVHAPVLGSAARTAIARKLSSNPRASLGPNTTRLGVGIAMPPGVNLRLLWVSDFDAASGVASFSQSEYGEAVLYLNAAGAAPPSGLHLIDCVVDAGATVEMTWSALKRGGGPYGGVGGSASVSQNHFVFVVDFSTAASVILVHPRDKVSWTFSFCDVTPISS